jgi:hypothetical protein
MIRSSGSARNSSICVLSLVAQLAGGITGGEMALLSSVAGALAGVEAEIAQQHGTE